jgi:exonuclease VII large subunit
MVTDLINDQDPEDEDELDPSPPMPAAEERVRRRMPGREERYFTPPPMHDVHTRMTEELNSLREQVKDRVASLEKAEEKIADLEVRNENQRAMILHQDRTLAELRAEKPELASTIIRLNETLDEYRKREEAYEKNHDSRIQELTQKYDELANDNKQAELELGAMTRRMAALLRQRNNAQSELAQWKTTAKELRLQLDEAREHVKELSGDVPAKGPEVLPERLMTWLRENARGATLEDPVADLELILNGSLSLFKTSWPIIAQQVQEVMKQFGKMGWEFKQGKVPLCLGGHCTTNGHTYRPYQCAQWQPKLPSDH